VTETANEQNFEDYMAVEIEEAIDPQLQMADIDAGSPTLQDLTGLQRHSGLEIADFGTCTVLLAACWHSQRLRCCSGIRFRHGDRTLPHHRRCQNLTADGVLGSGCSLPVYTGLGEHGHIDVDRWSEKTSLWSREGSHNAKSCKKVEASR